MPTNINFILPAVGIAIAVILVIIIIATSYVKAPPNKAYIITGLKRRPKILIGKAGLKLPFLERRDELLIEQLSIDIKTGDFVPTADFIGVNIDAVAKVQIRTDDEGIKLAMKKPSTVWPSTEPIRKTSVARTDLSILPSLSILA